MPYNNAFWSFVKDSNIQSICNQEELSYSIIEYILNNRDYMNNINYNKEFNNNVKLEYDYDLNLIKSILTGNKHSNKLSSNFDNKDYLFQILNNKMFYFDIRSLSNIERDYKYYGIKGGFDHYVIYKTAKIINNNICFNKKVSF